MIVNNVMTTKTVFCGFTVNILGLDSKTLERASLDEFWVFLLNFGRLPCV